MAEKRERMKRPAPVADLMAAIFRGKPAEKRLEEGKIWLVWDTVVGEQIAARARPVAYRDGILTVAVANAPWLQQLSFLKKEIIEKLNARLGLVLVRDFYLKAGVLQAPPPFALPQRKKERVLGGTEKIRIAEQSSSIEDPELREAVERLLSRHLASSNPPND